MESIQGLVEHIVYHNEENGYTVLHLMRQGKETVCVGTMAMINEGEYIRAEGDYVEHATYGTQFRIDHFSIEAPEDVFSIERYLGSGAIKGIGPTLAARIVNKFKENSFHIIENEPERLAEVKGISEAKAIEICRQFHEKQGMRHAMMFLAKYGITTSYAVKIYNEYGSRLYDIIRENPYQLAEDISGIGFRLADEIAKKAGIGSDSDYRVRSGIIYVLLQASMNGHTYLPLEKLKQEAAHILDIPADLVERQLMDLSIDKKIVIKNIDKVPVVYASVYYYLELNTARMLKNLNIRYDIDYQEAARQIERIEADEAISLDDMQKTAVVEAARNGVLVITGGPGTGKTTTINTIIRFFENEGMEIRLAAPTGRAAKRMTEATGYEAQTIHRMLELTGGPEAPSESQFQRNEDHPLEADAIIIDEMSMVDIHLIHALLKAILPGTRLIMVGDVNQLPSVGPGNVLKDIISSHCFNVVMLTKIFRQALESAIITNAHKINDGEALDLERKTPDFFCLKRYQSSDILGVVIALVRDKLPQNVHASSYDIQVLTPMRKGELGVENLNKVLQRYLNPKSEDKREKEHGGTLFREGDKVMQVKNNYQLEWEITSQYNIPIENGVGVFNGDTGILKEINFFAEQVTVEFDEGRKVTYSFSELDELELAYAITVHKSQGSEYPAIVLPLLSGPRMLFNRNILYTAVTRAKNCVAIVGSDMTVQQMIHNERQQQRYSSLDVRISEAGL
ncbi:MAG TPA: ATP-dependent RecD-like DNA helicase [Candidatus Onthocola gallistercoris]|uniref:ATP-dependent RecD2 DNA helicase n=1 Tax=Candidatus Onthocola gallistercoris TaxID=2840876 RepID=A0A9D1HGY6_9FIRM|nr:ATP-dependent RecD-like DNA helicase [Candidatus Onthocola gallistercoris]